MSHASSTPTAGPGTSSGPEPGPAYRRLPIRWRVAGSSALLTFAILAIFAIAVGTLTTRQIRSDFQDRVRATANELHDQMEVRIIGSRVQVTGRDLNDVAAPDDAHIRVVTLTGDVLSVTANAPDLGFPRPGATNVGGFRVESRLIPVHPVGVAVLQYAQPRGPSDHTIYKVRFFLLFGVLGGTGLALLAGLYVARRAMAPIAELTWTAREIERTGDASYASRSPRRTTRSRSSPGRLTRCSGSLDAARSETEGALDRQRAFVADASHELRTPLTSVLANLELLAEQLDGEQGEAAASALRSSQRMRRLVADLLLLARHDAGRQADHEPLDVSAVLIEAAAELEPVAQDHLLEVDARHVTVAGSRDELHRLAANLIENALRHTPSGTTVRASVARVGDKARLVVEDDGPGIPDEVASKIFERFVRSGGDRAGSSGLGLSLVRVVASAHGGEVHLEKPRSGHGARFVVTLPLAAVAAPDSQPVAV